MEDFKLYVISATYIRYLRQFEPSHILSSESDTYVHERKYLGVAYEIGAHRYFAPFSSPKESDYTELNGSRVIRKSIVPIIRMTETDSNETYKLLGTIKLNNMVPVPESELTLYDVDNEQDRHYKDLIQKKLHLSVRTRTRSDEMQNCYINKRQWDLKALDISIAQLISCFLRKNMMSL